MRTLLKVVVLGFLGLIVLSIAMTVIFAPSEEERAKLRTQEVIQKQRAEEELRAKARAKLQAELETDRAGVIREIKELMAKGDYLLAHRRADRFREFFDAEITALAESALAKYEEVERARKQQEEKRMATALQRMKKNTDKIEGVDWYRDKSSPAYNNQNGFFLYAGKRDAGSPWLRLRIQYHGDDWLFIESFIVVADGQRFERGPVRFERDHDSMVWEWYDENLSDADLQMIKAIIASKEAVIRFNGRQYRKDKEITASQKAALQNVLYAYKALGGKQLD